jgi:4-hydroxy-2-oxoheptanedioate aldolase
MDAAGIMVPHVMSVEDARQVVRFTKFPPIGRRPVDGGNADGLYCRVDFLEYVAAANDERFVLYQIEDPEPMDQVEEIAALPGVDGLFFGPGDFSVAIGKPGMVADPEVETARARVFAAARAAGKIAATAAGVASLGRLVDQGCNFVSIGADVVGLGQYADRLIAEAIETLERSSGRH